jgi:hypothetical protein
MIQSEPRKDGRRSRFSTEQKPVILQQRQAGTRNRAVSHAQPVSQRYQFTKKAFAGTSAGTVANMTTKVIVFVLFFYFWMIMP